MLLRQPSAIRGLPFQRTGVLVVEIFVMDANKSNNVLFDLYDLIG